MNSVLSIWVVARVDREKEGKWRRGKNVANEDYQAKHSIVEYRYEGTSNSKKKDINQS